ncbi:hypothetical protein [Mycobacterium intracellulare]|uniref:hypothetical protein n=1 Tax=Mycobacterium intracellulare TaxID=1767 RepID=UPI001EED0B18|nr:hypothetical protein [Mycobacterium intracellulare]MEE3755244.1 hypothetical protein [Mycobacterium intracellulare]
MSRAPAARAVALRDQLAAILRDAPTPLSTPQLAFKSGLPWVEFGFRGQCAFVHARAEVRRWRIVACSGDGDHRMAEPPSPRRVYPHLRALEKAAVIARVRYPNAENIVQPTRAGNLHRHMAKHAGSHCAYWHYIASRTDDTFESLIALEDR